MADGSIVFDTRIDNTQAAKDLQKLEKKIQETEKTIESLTSQKKAAQKESMFKAADLEKEKAALQEMQAAKKKEVEYQKEINALNAKLSKETTKISEAKQIEPALLQSLQEIEGRRDEAYRGMDLAVSSKDKQAIKVYRDEIALANKEWNKAISAVDRNDQKIKDATDSANRLKEQIKEVEAGYKKPLISFSDTEIKEQQARVNALQSEYNKVNASIGRYDQKLQEANTSLDNQKINAQMLTEEMQKANKPTAKFGQRVREAGENVETLENRIKRLASRVFVFSMITAALRSFRSWMGKVIKTDSEATAAMAKLKGALLTMVQPLVNVIIPAFVMFVNLLTRIATTAAEIMSGLFGQTIEQSAEAAKRLYEETEALDETGKAAKNAGKSLASFDEINKISGDEGGAGGKTEKKTPADFTGLISEGLGAVEGIVGTALLAIGAILTFTGANVPLGIGLMAIGAATLASAVTANSDKVVEMLQGPIGTITALISGALLVIGAILLFSTVNVPLGLGLMAAGAIGLATAMSANWDSIQGFLQGPIGAVLALISGALLVLGAILLFSGAHIGLGIGLLVAGSVGLATSIAANWETVQSFLQGPVGAVLAILSSALLVIGGVMAFSGANVPLGLGLMMVGAMGLATSIAANWDTISSLIQGPVGLILGILGTALLVIGGILAFSGVNLPLGLGLMVAGALALGTSIAANWDSLVETLGGPVATITALISGAILVLGVILLFSGVNVPLGLGLIVAGAVGLAASIAPNWDVILDKIKEAWARIKEWWNGTAVPGLKSVPNFFIKNVINKLLAGAENFINFFIDGINGLIGKLNSFGFDLPDIFGGGHIGFSIGTLGKISLPRVPALASGAVIPPNREFMAVLGDQRSGNNIEAPEDLIRQIAREEGGGNNAAILRQILAAIKEGKAMMVDHTVFAQLVSSASDSEKFRRGDSMVTVH